MNVKNALIVAFVSLSWLGLSPAFADNGSDRSPVTSQDDENAALVKLLHELDALAPLVSEAEDKALVDARVRLNYAWLRRDLELVKSGIGWHLNTPSTEPRSFEPLKGDYRY
jgi:RAQPRD family integrative conjugative element protein